MRLRLLISGGALVLLLLPVRVQGFALLGPYADWMDQTNSYRLGWEIGGPMNIGEEYRWNTPVVTYGFDQSFLDYFGSNGVNAVEQAIQLLNDLPAASALVISNYPSAVGRMNYFAQSQNLCDLKAAAVVSLIEQMGLAEATRSIFVLHRWDPLFLSEQDEEDWWSWAIPSNIFARNFDPETLATSHWVNGNPYTGSVAAWGPLNPNPRLAYVYMIPVDASGIQ